MHLWKKLLCAAVFGGWLLFCAWSLVGEYLLPSRILLREGEAFVCMGGLLTAHAREDAVQEAAASAGSSYEATLYLLDALPLKTVRVTVREPLSLIPSGMPFGVKLFTEGVVVAGLGAIQTADGPVSPAERAGIRAGDVLLTANGIPVLSNEQFAGIVARSGGESLELIFTRDGASRTARLLPVQPRDGSGWKAGLWVRDSSAGLGTLTYIDPENGVAAGLGHGVTDTDTGIVLPVSSGQFVAVRLTGIVKGQQGSPGELQGSFAGGTVLADLIRNCECGVFGAVRSSFWQGSAVPVAFRQEVRVGAVQLLCAPDGGAPRCFDAEILSLNLSDSAATRNLVLRITDPELLSLTGGIVQGMSGSPILQDGCLVGAVTHVFVGDPSRGYGIFIENMLQAQEEALLSRRLNTAA